MTDRDSVFPVHRLPIRTKAAGASPTTNVVKKLPLGRLPSGTYDGGCGHQVYQSGQGARQQGTKMATRQWSLGAGLPPPAR